LRSSARGGRLRRALAGRDGGAARGGPAAQVELHHDRVDVVGLVVPRLAADLEEALRHVQRLGDGVVGPHLEEDVLHPAPFRLDEEFPQQRAAPASAAGLLGDRDGLDVGIRRPAHRAKPGIADDAAGFFVDHVPAVRRGQLFAHHGVGPGVGRERRPLERHDRRQVEGRGGAERHALTRFGAPGIVTSGERR
jgi:hypothetical protein